jgi:hypothetical protein
MKKQSLTILLLISLSAILSAQSIVIGTGTSTTYNLPTEGNWGYSWCKMIFTASELTSAGMPAGFNITSLGYDVANNPSNYTMNNQQIYIRHTSATTQNQSYPGTAGFTQVFSDNITWNGSGWKTLVLTTPFAWNGTDNLEILYENHDGSWASGAPGFHYTSTSPNILSAYYHSEGSFPTGNGNLSYNRPNTMFTTSAVSLPLPAENPSPADGAEYMELLPDLGWNDGGGNPTGYKLHFGTTTPPPFIVDLGGALSWTPPAELEQGQLYHWQIVPYNANGDAENCPVWSFTTLETGYMIIGDGTATQRQPFGANYGFERTATLYSSAELGRTEGVLNQLGWYNSYGTNAPVPFKIYAKETNENSLPNQTWGDYSADAVLLMDDTHVFNAPGWNVFELTTPFAYTGSNLVILVETNYGNYGTSAFPQFTYTQGTGDVNHYWYSQVSPPTGTGYLNSNRPNVLMEFDPPPPGPPGPPILTYPANAQTGLPRTGFDLRWSPNPNGGFPDYYDILLSQSEADIDTGFYFPDITFLKFNPVAEGGLTFNYGDIWYWTVVAANGDGTARTMPPHWFRIELDPSVDLPFVEHFDGTALPYGWSQSHCDGIPVNNWSISLTNNAGGTPNEAKATGIPGIGRSSLVLPHLNTLADVVYGLSFDDAFVADAPGLAAKVEFSSDGENWGNEVVIHASADGNASGHHEVPFPPGITVAFVRYTTEGDHNAFSNWFLDDVRIVPVLAAPIPEIQGDGRIVWEAVPGATGYQILASDDPYGVFEPVIYTVSTDWENPLFPEGIKFYRVVAIVPDPE